MSHPNLFQVFHPICGVRASPLSYPKTSLESRSSRLKWLGMGLRSFLGKAMEGKSRPVILHVFYVWGVTAGEERHAAMGKRTIPPSSVTSIQGVYESVRCGHHQTRPELCGKYREV